MHSQISLSNIDTDWRTILSADVSQPKLDAVLEFLAQEREAGKDVFPAASNTFLSLALTPFKGVKCVILGQDPYPTPGHAHGLAFSVENSRSGLPRSLNNIFKELKDDLGIENSNGNLTHWSREGVLLLNSILSVESGKAGSHRGMGWEEITDHIISTLNNERRNLVFILWGNYARTKSTLIDHQNHLVIESVHPSPLSARKGFFGSRPFSRTNDYLLKNDVQPIDWRVPEEQFSLT